MWWKMGAKYIKNKVNPTIDTKCTALENEKNKPYGFLK